MQETFAEVWRFKALRLKTNEKLRRVAVEVRLSEEDSAKLSFSRQRLQEKVRAHLPCAYQG
jgi:hypothetical protein